MKNKIIIMAFAVLTAAGVYTLSANMDAGVNDAFATDTAAFLVTTQGTCTGGTSILTHAPVSANFTTGTSVGTNATAPTYTNATATLGANGVGGGGMTAQGAGDLSIVVKHHKASGVANVPEDYVWVNLEGPRVKVSGFQCAGLAVAGFKMTGDGTDDPDLDLSTDGYTSGGDNTYTSGDKHDGVAVGGAAKIVFGASSPTAGAAIDDTTDASGEGDGEVIFGDAASPATATGAYVIEAIYKVSTTARTSNQTDLEENNYVITY